MRVPLVLLTLCLPALAWIDRSPPGCSTRPCTYTLGCASATCNSTENSELQTVLNEAYLGDTIRLQAGRSWTTPSWTGYTITARPGTGTLLITTTGELPPEGTRVTPHHISEMPTILPYEHIAFSIDGGTSPPNNIKFRGIHILVGPNKNGVFRIGYSGSTSEDRLPYDITLSQVIMRYVEWGTTNVGAFMSIRGKRITVRDSYFQGAYDTVNGSEKQAIGSTLCIDCSILNNALLDVAGENMMFGGTGSPYYDGTSSGEVAYNTFMNHIYRMPTRYYTANTRYAKGSIINVSGSFYRANASCVSTGQMANDACNWVSVTRRRNMKNLFEIKNARDLHVHHNLFDGFWLADGGGGDQYEAVVYKVVSNGINTSANEKCVVPFTGTCSTNGTTVTSTTPLPDVSQCTANSSYAYRNCCKDITINGVTYAVADYRINDPYSLTITTSAGTQTNVPCSICSGLNCTPGYNLRNHFEYNVVRNAPQPFQIIDGESCYRSRMGRLRVAYNLFYNLSCSEFAQAGYGCASWTLGRSQLLFATGTSVHVRVHNNTIIPKDNSFYYSIQFSGNYACVGVPRGVGSCPSSDYPIDGTIKFRDNIMATGNQLTMHSSTPTQGTNAQVLTTKMWNGTLTRDVWNSNVIAGAPTTGYPTGSVYNVCPSDSGCSVNWDYDHPTYGKLFVDFQNQNFTIRPTHPMARAGYDGGPVGARMDRLPVMRRPSTGGIGIDVSTSSTGVTMDWIVSADMAHIACSVHLSTHWDMDSLVPGIPPAVQNLSRTRRRFQMTLNPGTYYYEVHCGSIEAGEFTI